MFSDVCLTYFPQIWHFLLKPSTWLSWMALAGVVMVSMTGVVVVSMIGVDVDSMTGVDVVSMAGVVVDSIGWGCHG